MTVVDEVHDWDDHPADVTQAMADNIARLRENGLDTIED